MSQVNLEFACGEQRSELTHHRQRRQQIFVWSNSILLVIFGASLAANQNSHCFSIKEGIPERILVSVLVTALTFFCVSWQWYHRKREVRHQQNIGKIYGVMGLAGCENSIYPGHYDKWGKESDFLGTLLLKPSRLAATALIGICTLSAVWVDLIF
ncbi:hypothetical protein HNR65_002421 [Desulfosalsimonas propionicica]|uniref:Transmembrane protein n=1 Tax=Desulfosalsimonas propionicica TaxID=332175 RepID=A0A7W0CAI0_9BACT|nr:hypothetical protein [Desulfosalsimonas propionicica]MBA2882087.1 hypothetical protein [Desulfosalsimonas propionicica]